MSKKNDLEKKKKEIEAIHQEYLNKLKELKLEQGEVVSDFIQELENKKIKEYKDNLNI